MRRGRRDGYVLEGIPHSAAGPIGAQIEAGLGLAEGAPNPEHRRPHLMRLTPKGEAAIRGLQEAEEAEEAEVRSRLSDLTPGDVTTAIEHAHLYRIERMRGVCRHRSDMAVRGVGARGAASPDTP
ncbi:hypothetical protein [Streptomyces sp. A0592]|uniref:hypothetical protein n=1 Tax=Streptomyces sp. A0592 TaxID=2563099 RepID=UPI0019D0CC71|nr:hypothetical protein [Streptomyces sp. A0592]